MIERLIYEQITGDEQIKGMLTTYNGTPAFFYQKSPQDGDESWDKPCYPRVDYNIDMRYDPERKMAGLLSVNIWCTNECAAAHGNDPDKAIEKRLLELLGGVFYTGSDKSTVCAVWNRSDSFAYDGNRILLQNSTPEVFGITMLFDLLEFPEQTSTAPDPVTGANSWLKANFPQVTAIAYDAMPPLYKPDDANPAVYLRFIGADSTNRQSYAVNWYTGHFAVHVIAESISERNRWTKAVTEQLQLYGEIILEDGSPMLINRITARNNADPLREGQIELTGQYGVLAQRRREEAGIRLIKSNFSLCTKNKN